MTTYRLAVMIALIAAFGGGAAHAQIKLAVRTEYPSVLLNENLNAFVTIENQTGSPIVINPDGGSNIDLRFVVTRDTDKDKPIPRSHARPLIPRMMARDGETYEGMVEVAHSFDVGGEGRYTIVVEVEWRGRLFRSESTIVDVVRGIEITSTDAALKGYEDLVRRYSLRYWGRDRYEHLFLSVDQADTGENLGVFDLGTVLRLFKPVLQVKSSGDVLVVHQSGPDRYTRTAFRSTRAEMVFVDQVYLREDGTTYETRNPSPELLIAPPKPADKRSWWSRLWHRETSRSEPVAPRTGASQTKPSKPDAPRREERK